MPELNVLDSWANLFIGLAPPNQPGLINSWVWPTDYSLTRTNRLPVMVSHKLAGAEDNFITKKAQGIESHTWTLQSLLLLREGRLEYPNKEAAEAEALAFGWVQVISDILWVNQKVGGIHQMGEPSAEGYQLFNYTVQHIQWETPQDGRKVFWGILLKTRIKEIRAMNL